VAEAVVVAAAVVVEVAEDHMVATGVETAAWAAAAQAVKLEVVRAQLSRSRLILPLLLPPLHLRLRLRLAAPPMGQARRDLLL
jgi:hypothetical protein